MRIDTQLLPMANYNSTLSHPVGHIFAPHQSQVAQDKEPPLPQDSSARRRKFIYEVIKYVTLFLLIVSALCCFHWAIPLGFSFLLQFSQTFDYMCFDSILLFTGWFSPSTCFVPRIPQSRPSCFLFIHLLFNSRSSRNSSCLTAAFLPPTSVDCLEEDILDVTLVVMATNNTPARAKSFS